MPGTRQKIPIRAALPLIAVLLTGCPGEVPRTNSNCSACHMKTLSCHIKKLIDIKALHAAWESSFHNSLLKESFHGCPHLNCVRCHPRLAELELKRPLLTSL